MTHCPHGVKAKLLPQSEGKLNLGRARRLVHNAARCLSSFYRLIRSRSPFNGMRTISAMPSNADLRDPRGFRVRFKCEHFIHHIKLLNKYGQEPKNRTLTIEQIRSGKLHFVDGRYSAQRASEIPWTVEIVRQPDLICLNWQILGSGDENYVRNFGTNAEPQWRVLVCKVIGQTRHFSTMFPCETVEKTSGPWGPLYRTSSPSVGAKPLLTERRTSPTMLLLTEILSTAFYFLNRRS
jgi:hypothetical protein